MWPAPFGFLPPKRRASNRARVLRESLALSFSRSRYGVKYITRELMVAVSEAWPLEKVPRNKPKWIQETIALGFEKSRYGVKYLWRDLTVSSAETWGRETEERTHGSAIQEAVSLTLTTDRAGVVNVRRHLTVFLTESASHGMAQRAPETPTGFTAYATSPTSAHLAWTSSGGESGFRIYRDGALADTVGAGVTAWDDLSLAEGSSHTYRVSAYNAVGESAQSAPASVTLPIRTPETVGGITATAQGAASVLVSWVDVSLESYYEVWHAPDGATWQQIGTVGAGVTSYTHDSLAEASDHWYKVRAVRSLSGRTTYGGFSSDAHAKTATTTPAAPVALGVSALSSSSLRVSWAGASGATGYDVYHSTDGSSFAFLTSVSGTSYDHGGLGEATQHWYKVLSFRTVAGQRQDGGWSNTAAARTMTLTPADPSGFAGSAASQTSAQLSWNAAANATGYEVWRNGGPYTTTGGTSLTNTGLTPGQTYTYHVRSLRTVNGQTAYGNLVGPVSVTPPLYTPGGLRVDGQTTSALTLHWTYAGATVEEFRMYRNGAYVGSAADNRPNPSAEASYQFAGLASNTTYLLEVSAVVSGVESARAATSGTTLETTPATPNPNASDLGYFQGSMHYGIRVQWADTVNGGGWVGHLEVSPSGGDAWSDVPGWGAFTPNGSSRVVDYNPGNGNLYDFRVYYTKAGRPTSGIGRANGARSLNRATALPAVWGSDTGSCVGGSPRYAKTVGWTNNSGGWTVRAEQEDFAVGNWSLLAAHSTAVSSSYEDTDNITTAVGTFNTYRIRYERSNAAAPGGLDYTDWVQFTVVTERNPCSPPSAPSGLSGNSSGSTNIFLSWTASSGDVSGYYVYRDGARIGQTLPSQTTYGDSGRTPGVTYSYYVTAYNAVGESAPSNTVSIEAGGLN